MKTQPAATIGGHHQQSAKTQLATPSSPQKGITLSQLKQLCVRLNLATKATDIMVTPEQRMEELQVSVRNVMKRIGMVKALPLDDPERQCLSDLDKQLIMLLSEQVNILEKEAEARRAAASAKEHMPSEVGEPTTSTAQWQTTRGRGHLKVE
ncbi:hypothetical protein QJQ45_020502 [Haematococcus lacustris]|nr:hypothetical protein QJQ45_020502 [Haematococcus lacustris]